MNKIHFIIILSSGYFFGCMSTYLLIKYSNNNLIITILIIGYLLLFNILKVIFVKK